MLFIDTAPKRRHSTESLQEEIFLWSNTTLAGDPVRAAKIFIGISRVCRLQ